MSLQQQLAQLVRFFSSLRPTEKLRQFRNPSKQEIWKNVRHSMLRTFSTSTITKKLKFDAAKCRSGNARRDKEDFLVFADFFSFLAGQEKGFQIAIKFIRCIYKQGMTSIVINFSLPLGMLVDEQL